MKDTQAKPAASIKAANDTAIQFDTATAADLFRRMSSGDTDSKAGKADKDNASLEFCQFAQSVVDVNTRNEDGSPLDSPIPRAVITEGFTKHVDSMRAMLAAEGNQFVTTVETEGKDTVYKWKGHGNNVKSIAKGVTEYYDVLHLVETTVTDEDGNETTEINEVDAIIAPSVADSFTVIKKAVEAARRYGEEDSASILRASKEALRDVCALLISLVIKSDDSTLIDVEAELVQLQVNDWNDSLIKQAELQAKADEAAAKIELPSDTLTDAGASPDLSDDAQADEAASG